MGVGVLPGDRILVVEDDPAICRVIKDMLEDTPLTVVCAQTDSDAYSMMPTLPAFRAIVLDINLGRGTTGFDVARIARQVAPDLAVIYISGEADDRSFRAFGVPDSGFLEKPFTRDQLLDALGQCGSP